MSKSKLRLFLAGISLFVVCSVALKAHDAMADLDAWRGEDQYIYIKATWSEGDKGVQVYTCTDENYSNCYYMGSAYELTSTSATWRFNPCDVGPGKRRFISTTYHANNTQTHDKAEIDVDQNPISVSISGINFFDDGTFDVSGSAEFKKCPEGTAPGYMTYATKGINSSDDYRWAGDSGYGLQLSVTWRWTTDTTSYHPRVPQRATGFVLRASACPRYGPCISDVIELTCPIDTNKDGAPDCDNCPNDPKKTEPGECGCGAAEIKGIDPEQSPVSEGTKIHAVTENPSNASVKWSIKPDPKDEGKVHASITGEGATATIYNVSGEGEMIIKVTSGTCVKEFTIKIGCEACEGGSGGQCNGEAGSASNVGL